MGEEAPLLVGLRLLLVAPRATSPALTRVGVNGRGPFVG